jgi:rhamnosyltransferase
MRCYGATWAADYIISSGSLINLEALQETGPFREDFFIDAIDVEWCFRAWNRGFSCWIDNTVTMPHRFGIDRLHVPFCRLSLVRQPPPRLYTYVRNRIVMIRESGASSWWRWLSVAYLMLQGIAYWAAYAGERRRVLRAFAMGISDGLRRRLGPGRRGEI